MGLGTETSIFGIISSGIGFSTAQEIAPGSPPGVERRYSRKQQAVVVTTLAGEPGRRVFGAPAARLRTVAHTPTACIRGRVRPLQPRTVCACV